MNYASTDIFESKLVPGVKYKLRKMSHGRRMEYNERGAGVFQKLLEIDREREPLLEEIRRSENAAKISPCSCSHDAEKHSAETGRCLEPGCDCRHPQLTDEARRLADLNMKSFQLIVDELYPLRIRWGVASIEGLDIDGKPATVDALLEAMPDAVIAELAGEIDRLMKLSPEEQLAFRSPGTSAAPVAGQTQSTSAATAN